jgi:hypothetical protein
LLLGEGLNILLVAATSPRRAEFHAKAVCTLLAGEVDYHAVWIRVACTTVTRAVDQVLLLAVVGEACLYFEPEVRREGSAVWLARLARRFAIVGVAVVGVVVLDGMSGGIRFEHDDDQQKQGEERQRLQLARGEGLTCMASSKLQETCLIFG